MNKGRTEERGERREETERKAQIGKLYNREVYEEK